MDPLRLPKYSSVVWFMTCLCTDKYGRRKEGHRVLAVLEMRRNCTVAIIQVLLAELRYVVSDNCKAE